MTVKLSQAAISEIEKWRKKFPQDKPLSSVIPALKFVQEENKGFLTKELMNAVADYLKIPAISVYEVASFYTLFDLSEVGKYKIYLCTNISCMLRGSEKIANHLKEKLKVKFGETSKCGKFTLKEAECLAACGGAPAMQINETYHENLTTETIDKIIDALE